MDMKGGCSPQNGSRFVAPVWPGKKFNTFTTKFFEQFIGRLLVPPRTFFETADQLIELSLTGKQFREGTYATGWGECNSLF